MKKMKNDGNVLQITLVLLLILSLNILSLCRLTINNSRSFQYLKQTNEIRLIENILIAHFKYENLNSILLSNDLEINHYNISYTVDDMGNYYLIVVKIKNIQNKFNKTIELELDREKNFIKKVE